MPESRVSVKPKKAYTFQEASPQIIKQMRKDASLLRKQDLWITLAQLGTALGILVTLWYAVPPLLRWFFPPL
ncbi:MAG TPA: hypothetical protein DCE41_32860 [Cytophagales bacterium]|nr:hypothetical protein [Cytophagales bacterium]